MITNMFLIIRVYTRCGYLDFESLYEILNIHEQPKAQNNSKICSFLFFLYYIIHFLLSDICNNVCILSEKLLQLTRYYKTAFHYYWKWPRAYLFFEKFNILVD